jgi:hypothetical protein
LKTGFSSALIPLSNLCHNSSGKNRSSVRFPLVEPSLFHRIVNVVLGCAKKTVPWITARWIIAAVATIKRFIEFTKGKQIGQSVCGVNVSPKHHCSVPVFVSPADPRPAFVGSTFFHLAPESQYGSLSLHNQIIGCATLLARQGVGASSFSH